VDVNWSASLQPSEESTTRITLVLLAQLINWRAVLTIVKPETPIGGIAKDSA
jgi:hypothetical protein